MTGHFLLRVYICKLQDLLYDDQNLTHILTFEGYVGVYMIGLEPTSVSMQSVICHVSRRGFGMIITTQVTQPCQ